MNNTTRSERYAVKSHRKLAMLTAVASASIITSASVSHIHADEVTTDTTPDATATQSTTDTVATPTDEKTNYEKAQDSEAQKLADQTAENKANEEAKAKADADAQAAQVEANAKAEAEATAKAQADADATAQANAQKLAEETAANEAAKAEQARVAQEAHDAEVAQQEQQAKDFAAQQAQESGSAQVQRDQATDQYNKDVATTQDAGAVADQTVDTTAQVATEKAADAQNTADQAAEKAQADATAKAEAQKATDLANQTKANDAAVKAQQQSNTSAETTAQKAVTTAQDNNSKSSVKPATPAPYEYDANDTANHTISQVGELPTTIQDPKLPASVVNDAFYSDYYGYDSTNDKTPKINGDATDAQQQELADYALTLINSYRTTHGRDAAKLTTNVEQAVIASAKARKAANMGMQHTGHTGSAPLDATNKAYEDRGMFRTGENLGVSLASELTMLSAKVNILNIITAMIFQDGAHGNGHLRMFMGTDDPNIPMGFAIQKATDGGEYPYVFIFQSGFVTGDDTANDQPLALTSTEIIENARGGQTPATQKALADAKAHLVQVKDQSAQKLTLLQTANTQAISNVNVAYSQAIEGIKSTHDTSIAKNATNYANQVASIKANATSEHDANATQVATKLAQLKDAYDAKIASIKDLTPDELAAKKASEKAAFDKQQSAVLSSFEAKQAKDLSAFGQQLDQSLAQLKTQLDTDLANKTAQGAKNVATLKANNATAYQALVAANAKALSALKTADAQSYAKGKADSDKYLDSINPDRVETPDTNPETPAKPVVTPKPTESKSGHTAPQKNTKPSTKQPSKGATVGASTTQNAVTSATTATREAVSGVINTQKNVVVNTELESSGYVYDAKTKVLSSVPKQSIVPSVRKDVVEASTKLPVTGVGQEKQIALIMASIIGLLGISIYVPKHLKQR